MCVTDEKPGRTAVPGRQPPASGVWPAIQSGAKKLNVFAQLLCSAALVYCTYWSVSETREIRKINRDQANAALSQVSLGKEQVAVSKEQILQLNAQLNIANVQAGLSQKQLELSVEPVVGIKEDSNISGRGGIFDLVVHNSGIVDIKDVKIYARASTYDVPTKGGSPSLTPLTFEEVPSREFSYIPKGKSVKFKVDLRRLLSAHNELRQYYENGYPKDYFYPAVEFILKYRRTTDNRLFLRKQAYPFMSFDRKAGRQIAPLDYDKIFVPQVLSLDDLTSLSMVNVWHDPQSDRDRYDQLKRWYEDYKHDMKTEVAMSGSSTPVASVMPQPPRLVRVMIPSRLPFETIPADDFILITNQALDYVDQLEAMEKNSSCEETTSRIGGLKATIKKYDRYFPADTWIESEEKTVYYHIKSALRAYEQIGCERNRVGAVEGFRAASSDAEAARSHFALYKSLKKWQQL